MQNRTTLPPEASKTFAKEFLIRQMVHTIENAYLRSGTRMGANADAGT
jgi:hypothetical protein